MIKIAILAAAGWKGAGYGFEGKLSGVPEICFPLETCPEPLLPLGGDQTVLSRLIGQLRAHDFSAIFAVVGQPGCLFPTIRDVPGTAFHTTEEQAQIGVSQTPWTWERLGYVASLAIPILSPDPNKGNYEDSYARALDAVGWNWDRVLMAHGDTVISDDLLAEVFRQEPNWFLELHPYHNLIYMTRECTQAYRPLQENRGGPGGGNAVGYSYGVQDLGVRRFKVTEAFPERAEEWRDVDYRGDFGYVTGQPAWMEQNTKINGGKP